MRDRAAQFSPFAALTGYDDAVRETARHTDLCAELTEDMKALLDAKLRVLRERLASEPTVRIVYFVPDGKKHGGAYTVKQGVVRAFEDHTHTLVMTDRTKIPIDRIRELDGAIFGICEI